MLVTKSGFKRVVIGVGHRLVGCIFAVVWACPYGCSNAALSGAGSMDGLTGCVGIGRIFAEGTAAGQAEAQSRIAEVHRSDGENAMPLVAHIAHRQQCPGGDLPLD